MLSAAEAGVLDLVQESVVLRTADGRILWWNAAAEALYGARPARAAGRYAAELFAEETPEEDAAALAILRAEGAWAGERTRRGAGGERRCVALAWRLRRAAWGGEAILETGRDVTDARRDEAALRKSEHRYRNLFQAMAASFWELDFFPVGARLHALRKAGEIASYPAYFEARPEFVREMMRATRVIDVNEQTVTLFGRPDAPDPKAELLTTVEPFWPEASSGVFAASVVAAVSGRPSYAAETRLRAIDGREFPALFTACFPPDTMNKGTLLVGVIDLSARVAAETALAGMRAEMARAARVSMLGELTASIAHEVKQPLAAIAANAAAGIRWLDRPAPEVAEARLLTGRIADDARRAAEIIDRIRGMVTGAAPSAGPCSANAALRDAAALLEPEIRRDGARVALRLDPSDPAVAADRVQLQQVVANLALNELQAMAGRPAPRLDLAVRREGDAVAIEVADTGPGIAPDHLPRLFESFFTTRAEGMGMGLAIVRGIVETFGGSVRAANRPEGGACFTVALPAAEGPVAAAAHDAVNTIV
ncbi:sensor histidine kinase [Albimonas pacifica]|uniref:histidine kinase n=1 Tax=Albimonas pacifica TaxID=1114924 RepID=A0A1I3FRT2_9RHOB|nr:ATP-binding protein [Albimonas pacifica]SFI13817.1 PAS domain S-box-containing protein [Albimonas pacifica]